MFSLRPFVSWICDKLREDFVCFSSSIYIYIYMYIIQALIISFTLIFWGFLCFVP